MTDDTWPQFPVGSWCQPALHRNGPLFRVVRVADGLHLRALIARLSGNLSIDKLGLRLFECGELVPATPTPEELQEWREALASVGLALLESVSGVQK